MDDTDEEHHDPRIWRIEQARRVLAFDDAVAKRTATRVQRLSFGTARLSPDIPLVYDASAIDVSRPVAVTELLPTVERVFGEAGLRHRKLFTSSAEVAWVLAPALAERDWNLSRLVYMVHDRTTTPAVSPLGFEEASPARWRAASRRFVLDNPWGSDAVAADRAVRDRRLRERIGARFLLSADDTAGCHIYRRGPTAQIEEVHVLTEARGRGLGMGLMAAALAACADAKLLFLVADADDWPRRWYERLGFTTVATGWDWLLKPAPAVP